MKRVILGLLSCILVACQVQIEPLVVTPDPKPKAAVDKIPSQNKMVHYQCKDNRTLRVVYLLTDQRAKLNTIQLTFNHHTRKLTHSISESGNKYTDIQWHWLERQNYGELSTALGEVLATQCVPQ